MGEPVDLITQLCAPFVRVEVGRERPHSAVVDAELAMRITAGCHKQHRAAPGGVQLALVDRDGVAGDVREHRERIAELTGIHLAQQVVDRIHASSMTQMDEVLEKAEEWRANGETVALATVVATRRSAPRPLGSKLAVTQSGRLFGSVSGGCVEADVAERARMLLADGSCELVSYGIADEDAWSVGLPCGGEIDVFVEPFAGAPPVDRGTSYVVVAGDGIGERWQDETLAQTGLREEEARTVFAERVSPPPRLLIIGAGDLAEALCRLAKPLGWHTVVADPRAVLATRERVPTADELIVVQPDEIDVDAETAVVSLVHEERIDLPALRRGVEGGAFYVGALGSKRRQEKLHAALGDIADRVHGPIGLDLGGEGAAEIALEVMAELLAAWKSRG